MLIFYPLIIIFTCLPCSKPPPQDGSNWDVLQQFSDLICKNHPENRYVPLIKKATQFYTAPPTSDAFVKRLHDLFSGDEKKVIIKYLKKYGEDLKNFYRPLKPEEKKEEDDRIAKLPAEEKVKAEKFRESGSTLHKIGEI